MHIHNTGRVSLLIDVTTMARTFKVKLQGLGTRQTLQQVKSAHRARQKSHAGNSNGLVSNTFLPGFDNFVLFHETLVSHFKAMMVDMTISHFPVNTACLS
jgi:hypothetical protein